MARRRQRVSPQLHVNRADKNMADEEIDIIAFVGSWKLQWGLTVIASSWMYMTVSRKSTASGKAVSSANNDQYTKYACAKGSVVAGSAFSTCPSASTIWQTCQHM